MQKLLQYAFSNERKKIHYFKSWSDFHITFLKRQREKIFGLLGFRTNGASN